MKRRKNIIVSAITCMFSICLMIFGVYAASNPSVTIGGQVSYSARDAKVLVLGKVNGQSGEDQTNKVAYPTVADTQNPTESEKVVSATQYMGYTNGAGANISADNLSPWTMNATHGFYEDTTGIRPITISFKMTNLSNYPVVATVDFTGVTDANLESHNLTRTTTGIKDNKVYLDKNITKEISVTYTVANDSKSVSGDGLLDMSITFEKTVFPTPSNVKSQQGETMQSDWEYSFDGDSFTLIRYKKTKPLEGETFEDPTIPTELVIPSQITCDDGKTYPVKTLGKITEEQFNDLWNRANSGDESAQMEMFGGLVIIDFMQVMGEEADSYMQTLPTNIVVSDGIETISPVALYFTTGVQTLPNSVTYIGAVSMASTGIQTLNLPNLTTIGFWAFLECSSLTSVIIPSGVKKIGDGAFSGCSALETVSVEQEDCTKILCGENIFDSVSSLNENFKIYVANESFKTAQNWSTYKDYMVFGNIVTIGDWTVNLDKNNLTCDIIKYVGDTTKTELTIPATFEYKNKTYNVVAVGSENANDPACFYGDVSISKSLELLEYYILLGDLSIVKEALGIVDNVTIPNFKTIVIQEGIQKLNLALFVGIDVKQVKLPQSLISFGNYAFVGCRSLQDINIPNKITTISEGAFCYCTSLKNIILPDKITAISDSAFQTCTSLQTVVLPNNLKRIEDYAFSNNGNLASITFPQNLEYVGKRAFSNCDRIAEVINLSNLNLKNLQTDYSLNPVRIANSGESKVVSEGDFKFVLGDDGSNYLIGYFGEPSSEIVLPSMTNNYKIKEYAFADNKSLISVTIPQCVDKISYGAFNGCVHLSEIINLSSASLGSINDVPRVVTSGTSQIQTIDDFKYVLGNDGNLYMIGYYGDKSFENGEVTLPDTFGYRIKSNAFKFVNMPSLLVIPNCVDYIGAYAFAGGFSDFSVIVPDSVTYLGQQCFAQNDGFDFTGIAGDITLGSGITSIDSIGCSGIFTIKATVPPSFNLFVALHGEPTAIYVPSASVDAYKAAEGWSNYADKIQAIA